MYMPIQCICVSVQGEYGFLSSQPSVWVCPPVPGGLSASCSWGGSSPAAAAATAGEGHRWSHSQRGSASQGVRRTPSSGHKVKTGQAAVSGERRRGNFVTLPKESTTAKKSRVLLPTQNNITNKHERCPQGTELSEQDESLYFIKPLRSRSPGRVKCWEVL